MNPFLSRRDLLRRATLGVGSIGLATLLAEQAAAAAPKPLGTKAPPLQAKAKRLVHLFMNGGPSQVDTFDPKPMLDKFHGKPVPCRAYAPSARRPGAAVAVRVPALRQKRHRSKRFVQVDRGRPRRFDVHHSVDARGRAEPRAVADAHELRRRPAAAAEPRRMAHLRTRGRKSESTRFRRTVSGRIADCRRAELAIRVSAGRVPGNAYRHATHRYYEIDRKHSQPGDDGAGQRRQLDLVRAFNEKHLEQRPGDTMLEARIQSFELAYRMQSEAAAAFDVSREPLRIREMYGNDTHGRQLLITRRLLERGVRVVQVWSGGGQPWDNHDGIAAGHKSLAAGWDRAIAAFLTDLKLRGLFDETLVMWGGEFGRTPVAELPALSGRDHNHYGFSMWLAGGGPHGGYVHGATDEFGFAAVENKVHVHDLHATVLRLMGFDHEKLTYRYAGRDFRLTDVHGKVIEPLIG